VVDVADLPALEFTRDKAHDLLVEFGKTAPRSGGMARQELRAAWRHAIASGKLPGPSPFEKMAVGSKDTFGGGALVANSKRERHLAGDEVGALLRWMAEPRSYSRTVGDALELVLRTGLRSGEVCGIHTRELVRREGVLWLDIPAERMKGKRPHSTPLLGRAERIVLDRMPEGVGYLFPIKTGGRPIAQKVLGVEVYSHSGRSTATAYKSRRVCPVIDWAPHDLRRTARTLLADLGCPYEVAEAILAHTLPGVAGVYNRAQYDSAKIEWLNKLGDHIDSLVAAQANLSVVEVAA
jgi:integrase